MSLTSLSAVPAYLCTVCQGTRAKPWHFQPCMLEPSTGALSSLQVCSRVCSHDFTLAMLSKAPNTPTAFWVPHFNPFPLFHLTETGESHRHSQIQPNTPADPQIRISCWFN